MFVHRFDHDRGKKQDSGDRITQNRGTVVDDTGCVFQFIDNRHSRNSFEDCEEEFSIAVYAKFQGLVRLIPALLSLLAEFSSPCSVISTRILSGADDCLTCPQTG